MERLHFSGVYRLDVDTEEKFRQNYLPGDIARVDQIDHLVVNLPPSMHIVTDVSYIVSLIDRMPLKNVTVIYKTTCQSPAVDSLWFALLRKLQRSNFTTLHLDLAVAPSDAFWDYFRQFSVHSPMTELDFRKLPQTTPIIIDERMGLVLANLTHLRVLKLKGIWCETQHFIQACSALNRDVLEFCEFGVFIRNITPLPPCFGAFSRLRKLSIEWDVKGATPDTFYDFIRDVVQAPILHEFTMYMNYQARQPINDERWSTLIQLIRTHATRLTIFKMQEVYVLTSEQWTLAQTRLVGHPTLVVFSPTSYKDTQANVMRRNMINTIVLHRNMTERANIITILLSAVELRPSQLSRPITILPAVIIRKLADYLSHVNWGPMGYNGRRTVRFNESSLYSTGRPIERFHVASFTTDADLVELPNVRLLELAALQDIEDQQNQMEEEE